MSTDDISVPETKKTNAKKNLFARVRKKFAKDANDKKSKDKEESFEDIRPIFSEKKNSAGKKKPSDFYYGYKDGKGSVIGDETSVLNISDFGEPTFSIKDWHLIEKQIDIISLEGKVGKTVTFPHGMNRGILIGPDGYRLDFSNIEKLTVAKSVSKGPRRQSNRHMYLMGVPEPAEGWFAIVESSKTYNLAEYENGVIMLNPESSCVLIGPEGAELDFTKISAVNIIPKK